MINTTKGGHKIENLVKIPVGNSVVYSGKVTKHDNYGLTKVSVHWDAYGICQEIDSNEFNIYPDKIVIL